ncbi:MAG: proline/glycine betaine ABC transporter permease [Bacillota bacterium]|nr:MAG: ABC transporter permease [Bacillota bacterium]
MFPHSYKLPLADWVDSGVAWLVQAGGPFFDWLGRILLKPLVGLENFLLWLPWWAVLLAVAAAAWKSAGWKLALGSALGLVFIGSLGLWTHAMRTLTLVIAGTALAVVVAIPTGIAMSRSDRLERAIRPLLDLMQTLPSFVYLVPILMLFGMGKVPAVLATFVYAVPPAIRLTNLGIRQVPADVVEAARAFGTTAWQMLLKVQLPLAKPTIMAGINQTVMMALSMVVIASMIGASGLGTEVLNGIARIETGRSFAGGISIVILAIIIDRVTQGLSKSRLQA